jgi:hypothetical protein
MTTMSKIVSMLFDEGQLFSRQDEFIEVGDSLFNCVDKSEKCTISNTAEPIPVLSNKYGTFPTKCVSVDGASSMSLNAQDDLVLLSSTEKPASIRTRSFSAPQVKPLKIDTKTDFQLALNGAHSPSYSLSPLSSVTIGPAASRRKWLGGPSSSLATIEENSDIESSMNKKLQKRTDCEIVLDSLDSELVIHNDIDPSKLKQMRVPQRATADGGNMDLQDEDSNSIDSMQSSVKTVPNMDEIEAAGEAFLDDVENNLRIRYVTCKI